MQISLFVYEMFEAEIRILLGRILQAFPFPGFLCRHSRWYFLILWGFPAAALPCGTCVYVCPADLIKLQAGKRGKPPLDKFTK